MAEAVAPKFEHTALEKDIERLATEIRTGRVEKEQTKETLKAALQTHYTPQPNQVSVGGDGKASAPSSVLPNYLKTAPDKVKLAVEQLLDMAWHKGIARATREAAKEGPLFLDAFHDSLTDKLYDEFKRRGIIK